MQVHRRVALRGVRVASSWACWGARESAPETRLLRGLGKVLLVSAVCATGALGGGDRTEGRAVDAYAEDFDAAWTFIRDTYAYFHADAVDWEQVRVALRPRATEIRDHAEFVGLLEDLVEHLCDHHAHLGVNTASSPRLVPSGADLWATIAGQGR